MMIRALVVGLLAAATQAGDPRAGEVAHPFSAFATWLCEADPRLERAGARNVRAALLALSTSQRGLKVSERLRARARASLPLSSLFRARAWWWLPFSDVTARARGAAARGRVS